MDFKTYILSKSKDSDFLNKNLNKSIVEYKNVIQTLKEERRKVGVICQDILAISLCEIIYDFIIFPSSVLESQVHREYGSTFKKEIILEIKEEKDLCAAKDFLKSVSAPHQFIGIDQTGKLCIRFGTGNPEISILVTSYDFIKEELNKDFKKIYKYEKSLNSIFDESEEKKIK